MSNNKDFKVRNGIQPTSYFEGVGTVVSASEGYILSEGVYDSKSFSVASQDGLSRDIAFNSSGTKLYVLGDANDSIFQYTLSTAWDISTASYDSVSFSVGSQGANPLGFSFKSDGSSVYVVFASNDTGFQYDLSTAFDISTASYASKSFDFSSQDANNPTDLTFNSTGTKMYMLGNGTNAVYQYTLSTAWDISTASYDSVSFSLSGQFTVPETLVFNNAGTSLLVAGANPSSVFKYSLSSAYDLSTASYSGENFSVSTQVTARGLGFKPDGTKMYVSGYANDTIYQYSTALNTASLDLSTGSVFEVTPASDIQVTLSNPADSGTVSGATLLLEAVGTAYTITYDPAIQWSAGTAPTAPAIGDTDVITFSTRDGGTTYSAALAIDGAA